MSTRDIFASLADDDFLPLYMDSIILPLSGFNRKEKAEDKRKERERASARSSMNTAAIAVTKCRRREKKTFVCFLLTFLLSFSLSLPPPPRLLST